MKTFKQFKEDAGAIGAGPTNVSGGIAGTGSSSLPQDQREPGGKSKIIFKIRRKTKI